jgi:hypothetical protein
MPERRGDDTLATNLFGARPQPNHAPFTQIEKDALLAAIQAFGATDEGYRRAAQRITKMAEDAPDGWCRKRYMFECREEHRRHLGAGHNPNNPASHLAAINRETRNRRKKEVDG